MNFITLLYRLGIDPASFKNQMIEPIKTDDGLSGRSVRYLKIGHVLYAEASIIISMVITMSRSIAQVMNT